MNANKIEHGGHRGALAALAIAAVAAIVVGVLLGYDKLRSLWLEQCVVRDMESQVFIEAGTMVKADVIADEFGLKAGANLALIDFDAKRKAILKKIPNLRSISVSRRLPDKVSIVTEERVPAARMEVRGSRTATGRVADRDGIVFVCQRGTRLLPVIREAPSAGTPAGHRLSGRVRAAMELIEAGRDREFQELGILEVDATNPDFLLATLGTNYSALKIAWDGMDGQPTAASRASLKRQLSHLTSAMRSRLGSDAVVWNATDFSKPGRIYADKKDKMK